MVISFPYTDKQVRPKEGRRIQWPKRWVTDKNYKDEDNSPKNNTKYCVSTSDGTYKDAITPYLIYR